MRWGCQKILKIAWLMGAENVHVEVIQNLLDLAKQLQLTPEELRNEMLLSKGMFDQTSWHMAADNGHVELIQKLWDLAKELQLKPEELRIEVFLPKG
jgi:CO/xanthine dehydrogenase Mo-binding subunit